MTKGADTTITTTERQRPYFHERWFGPAKRLYLNEAMRAVKASRGRVIEVGSWEGRSTIDIANFFYPEKVVAIDHWLGDLTNPRSGVAAIAAQRDVYADFKANIDAGTKGNYEVARMDWRQYSWEAPIRFLFIDGQHTYDEVFDNIKVALPLLVPGAVIAGDDYTIPGVRRAAHDALGPTAQVITHSGQGAAIWYWCYVVK